MTPGRERIAVPRDRRRPDGPADAPALDPGVSCRRSLPSQTARRCACACSVEDLVAFRDTNGRLGVLDEHCPHRRASLVLGRNEECGLRCLYHGWKIDVDGNVLEMASEPPGSRISRQDQTQGLSGARGRRASSGPTWARRHHAGVRAAGLCADTTQTKMPIVKIHVPCNWAQILEGQIDSAHSSSLHSSDMVPANVDAAKATDSTWLRPSTDKAPRMQCENTSYGFRYAAIRKPIHNRRHP